MRSHFTPDRARLAEAARATVLRLLPEGSPLRPYLRAVYRALRDAPERLADLRLPAFALDDVHDRAAWLRLLAAARCRPWRADAEAGPEGAAGLLIDLALREAGRFPRALTSGPDGAFARWVIDTHRLGPRAADNVRAALADPPGERVLLVYRTDHHRRAAHPFALTPRGRAAFVRWLLNPLRRRALALEAHHIVWFALASAEDETFGLVPTWHIEPELQRRFPGPLSEAYPRLRAFGEVELGLASLPAELPERWRTAGASTPWRSFTRGEPIEGVNVLGHMAFASGLGEAARNTLRAARLAGLAVSARDIPVGLDAVSPLALGLEHHPVTLLHVPGGEGTAHAHREAGLWRRPGVYRVGVWYWELERIPTSWRTQGASLDEVWCPTRFIADAVRGAMPVPTVPMFPGIEPARFEPRAREHFGLPPERFTFLFMFDMLSFFERKNPLAIIRAFRRAFSPREPVGLVIKVSRGHSRPEAMRALRDEESRGGVTIIDRVLTRADSYALIESCEAYVSLHRSEGYGLTMAEAMALGKPVIATAYSGNLDFMSPETACLVDHRLVRLERDLGPYPAGARWAEPDLDAAARSMRWVYEDRAGARAMGERARAAITGLASLEAYAERIAARLSEISARRD